MEILEALEQEESKLQRQLKAVQGAIAALNGVSTRGASPAHKTSANGRGRKRTMSAAGRANIIRAVRARWARIRAQKSKKAK
jgi:uncharacterized protein YoxC